MIASVANPTKTVDGKALPRTEFAYVGDPEKIATWHLPIDKEHIQAALDLFGHETHVPADKKTEVARRIAARARSLGIDAKNFERKYCGLEHADFSGGWVEIFRAGDYGSKGVYTADDLDRIVASYDPRFHEAPAVIGHPKHDMPAYGWTDRLMRQGDMLLAKFREVDPAFEEAVKSGRFKKRSAAFYLGEDGKISGLRHVGFLGAQPPEVKGLKNLNFDDAGREFTELEFGQEEPMAEQQVDKKTLIDAISEFFTERFGSKQGAQPVFSEKDARDLVDAAVERATKPLVDQITQMKQDAEAQTRKFAEREASLTQGDRKRRAAEAINGLKAKGSWVPAFDRIGGAVLFEELAGMSGTIEFGEADKDGKKPQKSPLEVMVAFMEGLGKIVPGGRIVEAQASRSSSSSSSGNAHPAVVAAREYQKANQGVTFEEAMIKVVSENPALENPEAAAAGAV